MGADWKLNIMPITLGVLAVPQTASLTWQSQTFTTTGTWTKPSTVSSVEVLVVAGGGGGGKTYINQGGGNTGWRYGGGGGSTPFMKSRTPANATSSVVDYDSIFNPSNLLVQDTSVFIIDSTSYYYVLGDLINSGSIIVDGTLKIGGVLYNSGSITGTGTII